MSAPFDAFWAAFDRAERHLAQFQAEAEDAKPRPTLLLVGGGR